MANIRYIDKTGVKYCPKCETTRFTTEFYMRPKNRAHTPQGWCKYCSKKKVSEWRVKHRDIIKQYKRTTNDKIRRNRNRYNFKKKYGITLEEKDAILVSQGRKCAACGRDKPGGQGWCMDHDHVSLAIRGCLCNRCNMILGLTKDSVEHLISLINYLKLHGK